VKLERRVSAAVVVDGVVGNKSTGVVAAS